MPLFTIEFEGVVEGPAGQPMSAEDLDALTDRLMELLDELETVIDPDVGATLSKGEFRVRLGIEADQHSKAYQKAVEIVESALAAAELSPDWVPPARWVKDPWAVRDHGWHIGYRAPETRRRVKL
jgi:hypothetical protein